MKSIKESKWLYILLSILIATSIWMYVRAGEDPEMENRVRGIPVTVAGDRVLENQGLMIDAISHQTVSLTWKGSWRDIGTLDKGTVSVSVDVSRITEPGVYELDYAVNYPPHVATSAFSLQNKAPEKITVTVSEIYSQKFDIHPLLKGSVASGYQAGDFIVEPQTVMISGVRQKVSRIDRVQVVLERKEMKESFSGDLPLRLLDEKGQELDTDGLRFSADSAYTVLPVVVVKEIPLIVNFIDGGGATGEDIKYTIEPKTITVSGPEKDMLHLNELSLGSIDLAQVMDTVTEEFPIYLPAELKNVSGLASASVKVTISGLTTKAFEVSNIELTNVPKGYKAALTTRVRTIVLRGTKSELDKVSA
ncbi:MAG: hypothetical protein E7440_07350, partial [Ruminococcaceae bacterium]|nr:hypothetical protein [Oscillospiraceae bacterium]